MILSATKSLMRFYENATAPGSNGPLAEKLELYMAMHLPQSLVVEFSSNSDE